MNFNTPRAARAFLLIALPLSAVAATAQNLRSSVTSFDKEGNAVIQETSGDPNRSSVTSFDKYGKAIITYTSPPVVPDKIGTDAPDPNPGLYNRFGYNTPYQPGYNYNTPGYGYGYGYPAPIYPPAYPVQNQAYQSNFGPGNSLTIIPLTPGYAYPAPYPVPVPSYGYPAYPYPVPGGFQTGGYPYGYPYGNAYGTGFGNGGFGFGGFGNGGFGTGTYSSNTAGFGINFGRGGLSASIGGSNTVSRSTTTITVR